ncbi:MAG TPA: sigma 54-interacting transcriptional regulator [Vicinamibacterales bacterium]|nr:sigma 54-interacting transcriptional regulator [Vicinamibacterales bacterium]
MYALTRADFEREVDIALADSFPASDPPPWTLGAVDPEFAAIPVQWEMQADVKRASPSPPVSHEQFALGQVLDFRPDLGIIRLHEQRVVILSAAAMGLIRKELIDTVGAEIARRLMMRFGYADGYHDAVSLREHSTWADPIDGLRAGVTLHRLEGIVRAEIVSIDYDEAAGRFEEELTFSDSYVAEQHVYHYGTADAPMCWSLAGYVSGYASACLGRDIYFRETRCAAQGANHCVLIGRDAASWGDELDAFRFDYQGADLAREVEHIREAVHRELQALERRERRLARRERELNLIRERVARFAASKHFISRSAAMKDVLDLAAQVAPIDTTVLVYGESGTGKEFVVRLIHEQSPRAGQPFVSVNCAALTETLLESELFGHVRGAFTGAVRDKAGLFEVAGNGTLFLDEVGEVAPTVQAKLLRALQEREIRRVGAERNITIHARVIAATNRDLRAAVAAGTFREDLYFRLGAFVITIPPLRDRREDIPALAHEFVRRAAARVKKDVKAISPDAMTALMTYRWPGNVRELEHAIERAVIVSAGSSIKVRELPPEISQQRPAAGADDSLDLKAQERALIERALDRYRGNRKQASEALHISTVTLWRKMKEYGLDGSRQ